MRKKKIVLSALITISALFLCCGDEKKIIDPGGDGTRTEREDCIDLFQSSLVSGDVILYGSILLEPGESNEFPEGYLWYNQFEDIVNHNVNDTFLTFAEDTAAVGDISEHTLSFELIIYPGEWDSVETFRGKECRNCWRTFRNYNCEIQLDNGNHAIGDFWIHFVVGPEPGRRDRYLIYQADDFRHQPSTPGKGRPLVAEQASLGAIKGIKFD